MTAPETEALRPLSDYREPGQCNCGACLLIRQKAAVARLTASATDPVPNPLVGDEVEALKERLTEALDAELGDAYDCHRGWEAWHVGTMAEDDFTPVNDRLGEIVTTVLACLTATTTKFTSETEENAKLRERVEELGWRDIGTAPKKHGEDLLLALENGRVLTGRWGIGRYDRSRKQYNTTWVVGAQIEVQPTHWMPFPAPPTPNQKDRSNV